MNAPEYCVIEEDNAYRFVKELNDASENGFKVIASNVFHIKYDNLPHPHNHEALYYALMVRNADESEDVVSRKLDAMIYSLETISSQIENVLKWAVKAK